MGLRSRGKSWNVPRLCWCFVVIVCLSTCGDANRDSCNWSGSGLDNADPSHVVRPVSLMCNKGHLKWTYPRGGLNVNFRPRLTSKSGSEFKVCLRVDPDFSGARIYLVGHRKLHPLHAGSDERRPPEMVRCFTSVKGTASIYVEAVQSEPGETWKAPDDHAHNVIQGQLTRKVASFSYDLRPLSQDEYQDDFEECRPCSDKEILKYFCQSDIVIKGFVTSIRQNAPMETSELGVKVTKVTRGDSSTNQEAGGVSTGQTTTLLRPLKCGSKLGEGEFLFLARRRLGETVVTCAPRWQEWKRIRRKALLDESNLCNLD